MPKHIVLLKRCKRLICPQVIPRIETSVRKDCTCSRLHRVASDEIFHFNLGDSVKMLNLFADGSKRVINLGTDILNGQQVQVIVPKGTWQGALIESPGKFALMGCTVAPAFEFEDFEIGEKQKILDQYPEQHELIEKLL